jgi:hypothetical protein
MAKIERQSLNNISINQLMILTNKCGRFPYAHFILVEWSPMSISYFYQVDNGFALIKTRMVILSGYSGFLHQ